MARKRYTPEQIIRHLRQAEVFSSQGRNVSEIWGEEGLKVPKKQLKEQDST